MGRNKKMPIATQRRIKETLREGKLEDFGYKMNKTDRSRHLALARATKKWGALSVFKSLVLLKTFNMNHNPELATIAEKDAEWIGKTYGIEQNGFKF